MLFKTTSIFAIAVKCLRTISNLLLKQPDSPNRGTFDLPTDRPTRRLPVKAAQITELLKHLSSSLISILIVEEDRSEGMSTYIQRPLM